MIYRKRQPATTVLWLLLPTLVAIAGAALAVNPLAWSIFAVVAVSAFLFSSLTVEVDRDNLSFYFGPGFWRKRIPLSEIAGVRPVRNKWWYGLGIHYTPHGWLYNVSGLDAVEIEKTGGKTLRIGTDEPVVLTDAIAKARETR